MYLFLQIKVHLNCWGGKSQISILVYDFEENQQQRHNSVQCRYSLQDSLYFIFFCDLVTKYLLDYNINAQRWDFTHSYGCAGVSGSGAGGLDCSSQTLSPLNSLMPSAVCWENNTKQHETKWCTESETLRTGIILNHVLRSDYDFYSNNTWEV